jgi:glycosyltransferase involved in cell wall biosynthesis
MIASEKKTILYVHHAGGFGGAPKSMSFIIKNLDQKKYNPVLVNIARGPINSFFSQLPIKLILAKGIRPFHGSTVVTKSLVIFIRNWVYLIPSIIGAFRLIKKTKPDVMHLNSTCLFAFAIAANFIKKKPKVICHVREPLRKGFWGWPLRFFCSRHVDAFIAISNFDLNSLGAKALASKDYKVVYNFVNILEYFPAPSSGNLRKKLGIAQEDIVFLYLARFSKGNGWEELIEMAREVTSGYNKFHFVLIGATEEQLTRLENRSKNIHFLSFTPDVVDILRDSDVFVCPFTEPHFARGIIEASAVGLPILASQIGGVDELVKVNKTGYLYSSKDEFKAMAIKLGTDDSLRRFMGENGVLFAQESFNEQVNLKITYGFYDAVLNNDFH